MTYYETLGVAPDASQEEIRRAYQRKAKAHHPDRAGGDDEIMKSVQQAYDCLYDPARREAYDNSGVDFGALSIASESLDLVTRHLSEALDAEVSRVVDYAYGLITVEMMAAEARLQDIERKRRLLGRRRGKFAKRKEGDNLLDRLIDKKLVQLTERIPTEERIKAICVSALNLLSDYTESREDDRSPIYLSNVST